MKWLLLILSLGAGLHSRAAVIDPVLLDPAVLTAEKAKAANVAKALERVRRDLDSQSQEYNRVLKSLQNINREMKRFVEEKSELDQERILTDAQLKTLAEKMKRIEGNLIDQRGLLLTKLGSLNRFNQEAWLAFLLQARNSAQLERNMKILGMIGNRDVQAMKDYSRLAKDLSRQRDRFVDRLNYLKSLQEKINEMENGLKEQTELRGQILSQLKDKQKKTLARLKTLQQSQGQLARFDESGILDALLKNSFAERKGQLAHPVDGQVTQNYGVIRDTEFHLILSHRGWMYEAPTASPVRSVFEGQVVHKGFFPEYGNFLVVDHADHFYSVYAMLENSELKVGDQVKEGQQLGVVGVNPFDGRTGLYFEIRHFAETVDPKVWMKGRVYEISNLEWDR